MVPVLNLATNSTITCRAYHLTKQPSKDLCTLPKDQVPYERQPSKTYLKTIVQGAIETGIKDNIYIDWLKSLKHNGKMVDKFEKQLHLENVSIL